jgi:hypothetical protein
MTKDELDRLETIIDDVSGGLDWGSVEDWKRLLG